MKEESKIQIGKMRSLIERMDKHQYYDNAMLNESKIIAEAVSGERKQVSRDEIIDILNAQDENGNGKFVSLTYVKAQKVYSGKRNWRTDDVTGALGAHSDMAGKEWHKNLTAYNDPSVKGTGRKEEDKNPVRTVIAVQRYTKLRWTSPKSYASQYNDYNSKLAVLRMKNGIGMDSNGTLGDNHNQKEKNEFGQFNQTGRMSHDFNMKGAKCNSTCYLIGIDGEIVDEIPNDVIKSMMAPYKAQTVEKGVAEVLTGDELQAYIDAKRELDAEFNPKNLPLDQILCICATVDGQAYYFINDAIAVKDSNVDPHALVKIAEEQLSQNFNEIDASEFAN